MSEAKEKQGGRVCPKCGKETSYTTMCPHCGYQGYMPLSEAATKRVRLILFVVILAVAAVVYLFVKGIIHF